MRFGYPKVQLTKKYDGRNDPCNNLGKWTKVYETEPQLEWVHLFCHTIDIISMN